MKSFAEFINETNTENKGAFKNFPREQQPSRIPSNKIRELELIIKSKYGKLGQMFIPDALKKANKETHGDLDVIFSPSLSTWADFIRVDPDTVAHTTNGGQLMIVTRALHDGNQYMVDFITTSRENFKNAEFYYKFGPALAVALGAFAKSLGYRWGMKGLYKPFFDNKRNLRNVLLTSDILKTLRILMLEPTILDTELLYEPKQLANWLTSSPRFDSEQWKDRKSFSSDTHKAARERPEVEETFKYMDVVNKKSIISDNNYEIERKVLGNSVIDSILEKMSNLIHKSRQVLTGTEIINLLNVKPGPIVGEYIQFLNNHPDFAKLTQAQLDKPEVKQHAKNILLKAVNVNS